MSKNAAVLERYSQGAEERQEALCCPVDYDTSLLKLLPEEMIEKDYGCGDPSRYVQAGDKVLDLGSGSGKICYMAAQLVGEHGSVIGVDMNDDMLALARKYKPEMAAKLGGDRVEFVKGQIQDLALNVEQLDNWLTTNPVTGHDSLKALEKWRQQQRKNSPLIPDNSVDLVISNCVLNLVDDEQKSLLVDEIFRVVKPGGRIAISDIISDEVTPAHLKDNDELWSGCISGAFEELEMLTMFADAGFQALSYDKWTNEPWQIVENIEFRSVTLTAVKPHGKDCIDRGQAVIYKGRYSQVEDDDGHVFPRGERMAVCERTFRLCTEGPYRDDFIGISPAIEKKPVTWCAAPMTRRPTQETKGGAHTNTTQQSCC